MRPLTDRPSIVLVNCDNLAYGGLGCYGTRRDYGGSNGLPRGCEGTTWEGGLRLPRIAWWPGRIPAGSGFRPIGRVANPRPLTTFDPACPYFTAMYDLDEIG